MAEDDVKRVKSGSREAGDRLSERPDAARETERTPHGIGAVTPLPDERNGPRHGGTGGGEEGDGEGAIGTMPDGDPGPRRSRFGENDLHEGDNAIVGEGATIKENE